MAGHRVCTHRMRLLIPAALAVLLLAVGVATLRATALGHADAIATCTTEAH